MGDGNTQRSAREGIVVGPNRIAVIMAMSHETETLEVVTEGEPVESKAAVAITKREPYLIYPNRRFLLRCPYFTFSIPVESRT